MINFKQYIEESSIAAAGSKPLETLPLLQGHDGVSSAADMLFGLHKALSGKKSPIKTSVDLKGLPITFGMHPKNKKFFVSHGGVDSFSPEEIDYNHEHDPKTRDQLKAAFEHIPKVLPNSGGLYNGKILYAQNNVKEDSVPSWLPNNSARMGLAVDSDYQGKLLTNNQKSKFNVHPDVYMVNPEVRADPTRYDPESQHNFLMNMEGARKAYGRLDPDAFDTIKGHETHLNSYIKHSLETEQKPSVDGYGEHLMQHMAGKAEKARSIPEKTKINSQYTKMAEQLFDNKEHFHGVINLLAPLHTAQSVLSKVVSQNNNPGNVTLYKGDNKATVRVDKR